MFSDLAYGAAKSELTLSPQSRQPTSPVAAIRQKLPSTNWASTERTLATSPSQPSTASQMQLKPPCRAAGTRLSPAAGESAMRLYQESLKIKAPGESAKGLLKLPQCNIFFFASSSTSRCQTLTGS